MVEEKKNVAESEDRKIELHLDFFSEYIRWRSFAVGVCCILGAVLGVLVGTFIVSVIG